MAKSIIADSSALVAFLSREDQYHAWMAANAGQLPVPWVTCEPALTEAFHLLGDAGVLRLKEMLRREALILSFDLEKELKGVLSLMDKYTSVPMSLTDACLVRMSEMLPNPVILTTDSDFGIYRRHGRQVVPTLMPA